jgi:hypothetical protein
MNLIYLCVFHQEGYINLLKLVITSILTKTNMDKETTDILVFEIHKQNTIKVEYMVQVILQVFGFHRLRMWQLHLV